GFAGAVLPFLGPVLGAGHELGIAAALVGVVLRGFGLGLLGGLFGCRLLAGLFRLGLLRPAAAARALPAAPPLLALGLFEVDPRLRQGDQGLELAVRLGILAFRLARGGLPGVRNGRLLAAVRLGFGL